MRSFTRDYARERYGEVAAPVMAGVVPPAFVRPKPPTRGSPAGVETMLPASPSESQTVAFWTRGTVSQISPRLPERSGGEGFDKCQLSAISGRSLSPVVEGSPATVKFMGKPEWRSAMLATDQPPKILFGTLLHPLPQFLPRSTGSSSLSSSNRSIGPHSDFMICSVATCTIFPFHSTRLSPKP